MRTPTAALAVVATALPFATRSAADSVICSSGAGTASLTTPGTDLAPTSTPEGASPRRLSALAASL